jgi:hypothetical protein
LGRCIGSGGSGTVYVYLYNPFVNPAVTLPGNFPSVPGYSVKIVSPSTSTIASVPSFPFQLYTNTSAQIYGLASSSSGSPTANCMTDGWVWHRAQ